MTGWHPTAAHARYTAQYLALAQHRASGHRAGGLALIEALHARAAVDLGHDDPVALEIEQRMEEARSAGRPAMESVEVFDGLQRRCLDALGEFHPITMAARSSHAQWLRRSGDYDQGIRLYRRELVRREKALGDRTYRACMARGNLAVALRDRGQPKDLRESLALAEQEIAIRTEQFGEDHAFTWVAVMIRVLALLTLADRETEPDARAALARDAHADARTVARRRADRLGSTSAAALKAWRNEARVLLHLGRAEEAVWLLAKVRAGEAATGREEAGRTERYLAEALAATGNSQDREEAVRVARQAIELCARRGEQGRRDLEAATAILADLSQQG